MQLRREELEKSIKTESFYNWKAMQKEKYPESLLTTDPVCAICLDEFDEDAQIRGLRCSHAFHTQCLDEWFGRYNEYCPLCHRTIIPGKRVVRARMMERPRPIPVAFMVRFPVQRLLCTTMNHRTDSLRPERDTSFNIPPAAPWTHVVT
jgi:hypothetical protein